MGLSLGTAVHTDRVGDGEGDNPLLHGAVTRAEIYAVDLCFCLQLDR